MKNYLFLAGIFVILLNLKVTLAQITHQPGCVNAGEFIPHPENCQWFIQCTSVGTGQRGECPPGELFNPIDRFCDPEDEVDCDAGLDWNGVCEERHVGLFFPHPLTCEKWIFCENVNRPVEGWCDEGMYFDPIERACDAAKNVDCRIGVPTTTSSPWTTSTRPVGGPPTRPGGGPPTRPGGGPPTRPGGGPPTRPGGGPPTRPGGGPPTRPGGGPPTRPGGGPPTRPGGGPPTRLPTGSSESFVCEERHIGSFLPHPQNCEMWIFCQGIKQVIEGWCGSGMNFNPNKRACDLARNVNCLIGIPTTTRSPWATPTRPGAGGPTRQ